MSSKSEQKELFQKIKFCPLCGERTTLMGTTSSGLKICPGQCGVLSVIHSGSAASLGVFLEPFPYEGARGIKR